MDRFQCVHLSPSRNLSMENFNAEKNRRTRERALCCLSGENQHKQFWNDSPHLKPTSKSRFSRKGHMCATFLPRKSERRPCFVSRCPSCLTVKESLMSECPAINSASKVSGVLSTWTNGSSEDHKVFFSACRNHLFFLQQCHNIACFPCPCLRKSQLRWSHKNGESPEGQLLLFLTYCCWIILGDSASSCDRSGLFFNLKHTWENRIQFRTVRPRRREKCAISQWASLRSCQPPPLPPPAWSRLPHLRWQGGGRGCYISSNVHT